MAQEEEGFQVPPTREEQNGPRRRASAIVGSLKSAEARGGRARVRFRFPLPQANRPLVTDRFICSTAMSGFRLW